MMDLKAVQDRMGLSRDQLRRLFDAIRPVLEERSLAHAAQGRAIQIDPQAIPIFERANDLKARGVALKSLADALRSEIEHDDEPHENGHNRSAHNPAEACPSWQAKAELIEYLKSELESRDETIRWLRERVETLEPLALPAPRRGPLAWASQLFRRES